MAVFDQTAAIASFVLRVSAYLFLRWIPGHHFPPLILTSACIYFWAFSQSWRNSSPFKLLADEIDIVTADVQPEDLGPDGEQLTLLANRNHAPIRELDVRETVVLEERQPAILRSLLLGVPSPISSLASLLTACFNVALVLMTLDLIYTAPVLFPARDLAFSRVGHVSYNSAKLLLREPDVSRFPISVSYREAELPSTSLSDLGLSNLEWILVGHIDYPDAINQDTDFTASVTISNLQSDTRYEYVFSNNQTGNFITAPEPGEFSKRQQGSFNFLHSSCLKPRVPYNPLHHPLHIPGLRKLAKLLPELGAHFMLFLGDFIYIDVPRRLGADIETYRGEYRRVYASPDWRDVSSSAQWSLPWIHVWDDHEIANDWDKNTTGVFTAAADPFQHYQISVNPPTPRAQATWSEFTQGPATFFLMDTRTYRSPENKNTTDARKTMLGAEQLADLLHWLQLPVQRGVKWKFIVSSIPFTKNWRFGDTDTWGTYLYERQLILQAGWKFSSRQGVGVVVLSGDRHEFAATKFPPPIDGGFSQDATIHEFSTSPLSMFYLPLRTYRQNDQEDICIKYVPDGNSKFGAIEIRNHGQDAGSSLHYRLFVDGKEHWQYDVNSPPSR